MLPETSIYHLVNLLRNKTSNKEGAIDGLYDLLGHVIRLHKSKTLPTRSPSAGIPTNEVAANELETVIQNQKKQTQSNKTEEKTQAEIQLPGYITAVILRELQRLLVT